MALLRSGVSVDLPEGKQILAYEIRPGSKYIDCQVQQCSKEAGEISVEIIVILRVEDVLLPNPESVFKQGDRLLVIASPQGRGWLAKHFLRLNTKEEEEQKMS